MSTAPAKVPATGAGTAAGGVPGGLQHYMCHLQVRGATHDSRELALCVHGCLLVKASTAPAHWVAAVDAADASCAGAGA